MPIFTLNNYATFYPRNTSYLKTLLYMKKTAFIYDLNLIGSIDAITALYKLRSIDKDKAIEGLKRLREFGWFQGYLIDSALEDIRNA